MSFKSRKTLSFLSSWWLWLWLVYPLEATPDENLVLRADKVTASSEAPARMATDGVFDTIWQTQKGASDGVWIEIEWAHPVQARELVIKQYTHRRNPANVTRIVLQAWTDSGWRTVKELGDGGASLPVIVFESFPLLSTRKIRLSDIRGDARFREIELYEGPNPPVLDVRCDAAGTIIGVLTDAWGARAIPGALVQATGTVGKRSWTAKVTTSRSGEFSLPRPVGLTGPVEFVAHWNDERIAKRLDASDIHQGLVPLASQGEAVVPLTGEWRFSLDPPLGFERPDFKDQSWRLIRVPSHWIMEGFHDETGRGGYRRVVTFPSEWKGKRIRLAFDGVYSGAEVWVNGVRVGSHLGGATPFQLDISDCARPGEVNLVAIKVTERTIASQLDGMSLYADFPLAGIFRKAYAFAVPGFHVSRLHTATEFDAAQRDALLHIDLSLSNESEKPIAEAELEMALVRPDGQAVLKQKLLTKGSLPRWSNLHRRVSIPVKSPLHWEAEHPELYDLRIRLLDRNQEVEQVQKRVGFREVRIRGTQFLVNGVPIKLKGTCHHDSHPLMGRAVTEELTRQDLKLMKEANLEAIRTSHYPPIPELLDLADEMGFYVESEAPFCWYHDTYDLRRTALVKQLTAELLERDRSHPSVLYWSAANESSWGPVLFNSEQMIKEKDPTRPVMGTWSDHFDLAILHNPLSVQRIRENESLSKPLIFDESLCIYQGIWSDTGELWRDPGYRDYYVAPLIETWEEMLRSKVTQGSFIWAWSDDLFAVPGRAFEHGRAITAVHDVDRVYRIPGRGLVGDAPWGVVDGWRRKKPEFWHVKKIHSPVRVPVSVLDPPDASGDLGVPVENRYYFSNLAELTIVWEFQGRHGMVSLDLPPQHQGMLRIPIGKLEPAAGGELILRFQDKSGNTVEETRLVIGEGVRPEVLPSGSGGPLRLFQEKTLAGGTARIVGDRFEIGFSMETGLIRRAVMERQTVLFESPRLHILPIEARLPEFPHPETWVLDAPLQVRHEGPDVVVMSRGHYNQLEGSYRTTVTANGVVRIQYDFQYKGPEVRTREIGLRFAVPPWFDRLSWKRKGEWTVYPDDHIGRNRGTARAHSGHSAVPPQWSFAEDDSVMGTNDFRSTKRNIVRAQIDDSSGLGIEVVSDGTQHCRAIAESDRIAVHVNDWFGGTGAVAWGEWSSNYGTGKPIGPGDRIQGSLTLHLLGDFGEDGNH
ncbi:MAG: glycoside hydrolase family 2 TIM barrel-domain containing protein [Acidobacteriota bacterium]